MTYSLSITGASADQHLDVKNVTVGDAAAGQVGSQLNAMQTGLSFLCKGPDGAQAYYRIDAERSATGSLILVKT
jgi:hypothetical protein